MTTVLVADNDPISLRRMSDIVQDKGFSVLRAINPSQAKAIIGSHRADVAVIDLRLEDDTDEHDLTGLEVAEKTDEMIPKIIVSRFESKAVLTDALKINIKGSPTIVDFVRKTEIATSLIPAIENTVRIRQTWSAMAQSKVSNQLYQDYKSARRDARVHYWVSLGISIGFALLIFYGAFRLHGNGSLTVLFAVSGVLVAEITNYLFSRKLEFLARRVERFHAELLQTNRFEQLLEASYAMKDETARENFKGELFRSAADQWLRKHEVPAQLEGPTGGKPE